MSLIIPDPGILRLDEALERYPGRGVVLYHRVSSHGQAGRRKKRLEDKLYSIQLDLRRQTGPGVLRSMCRGVELGTIAVRRRQLLEAIERARQRNAILCAADLSRFIRAKDYCRQTNPDAWPTVDEFDRLFELANGVPLATLIDPLASESKRHSVATRRTGKFGRPPRISGPVGVRIFEDYHNGRSYREMAQRHGVPKSTVENFIRRWTDQPSIPEDAYEKHLRERVRKRT